MHYSAIKIVAVLETAIPAGKEFRIMASFDREDWQAGSLYMVDFPKAPTFTTCFYTSITWFKMHKVYR